ncbi:MAG TPA: peptide-methionine (S)-S-oxide reductase MsrA [Patescibacteria group bacterium]|nr:peptide-methionine (S)-S-oxide reductase MsrA [Patescibacteria group bacterium]
METLKESIVLGGGCFWCLDAAYRLVKGVTDVTSGYAGGTVPNPTYEQVYSKSTGHAEVVKVDFDSKIISLEDILNIFWIQHDPTSLNRQMYDEGPEYRSIILYSDESQKQLVEKSKKEAQKLWDKPIVTEVVPLKMFYAAEDSHQNYFEKHPEASYCQIIINPKLKKLREKFATLLKV